MTEQPDAPFAQRALSHVDGLFRLARHLTGRDGDAEDLVQETYARALGKSTQFKVGTDLRAWLYRILRNTYIDGYRRARRAPARVLLEEEELADGSSVDREPLRGDVELERLRHVVAEDIETALASLSEDARTLVLLDLEGFTESELAEVLGCAQGTIKSRLSRARAVLRRELAEYGSPTRSELSVEPELKKGGRR